jgi:hypothetical protein
MPFRAAHHPSGQGYPSVQHSAKNGRFAPNIVSAEILIGVKLADAKSIANAACPTNVTFVNVTFVRARPELKLRSPFCGAGRWGPGAAEHFYKALRKQTSSGTWIYLFLRAPFL